MPGWKGGQLRKSDLAAAQNPRCEQAPQGRNIPLLWSFRICQNRRATKMPLLRSCSLPAGYFFGAGVFVGGGLFVWANLAASLGLITTMLEPAFICSVDGTMMMSLVIGCGVSMSASSSS